MQGYRSLQQLSIRLYNQTKSTLHAQQTNYIEVTIIALMFTELWATTLFCTHAAMCMKLVHSPSCIIMSLWCMSASLEPRLSVPDFVSQLWIKISDFSPKLWDKIWNGKPGCEATWVPLQDHYQQDTVICVNDHTEVLGFLTHEMAV